MLFACDAQTAGRFQEGNEDGLSDSDQPVMQLRLDQRQGLSASWLRRLLGEAGYDVSQTSSSPDHPFIIGPQDGLQITATPLDSPPWIVAESSDQERQGEVDELVQRVPASGPTASQN